MRPTLVVPWVALAVIVALHSALARERLAVLVSVAGDPELADNLSEVVISKLSSSSSYELVGQRELNERLLGLEAFARGGLPAWVEEPQCLSGAGAAANAKLAVIGLFEKRERRFSMELLLVETQSGFRRAVVSQTSAENTEQLIASVEQGVGLLFDESAHAKPPSAERRPVLELVKPVESRVTGDRPTNAVIAYVAFGAALVALSGAVTTRAKGRRAGKLLLFAAATLGVAAVVVYFWR